MAIGDDVLGLLRGLDRIYEDAVSAPVEYTPETLVARGEDLLARYQETARADRIVPRLMRRGVRTAVRLREHWEERPGEVDRSPEDWRSRVDQAMGGSAWKPGLDLAHWALEADPSPELFREVSERFRWVHLRPWMEGTDYHEWLGDR